MRYFSFRLANHHLQENSTKQKTTLNLNAAKLNSPHILKVGGIGLNLSGKIFLNGSILHHLSNSQAQIDIAPLLTKGKNIVEIIGKYYPQSFSIQVEFLGKAASVSHKSSANGSIEHILILNIY
ncbi:MAG: hypothetical protein ACRC2R_18165 [Xenococcaceae cyanobacterium]